MNLEHHTIATNGIHLHAVQTGPKEGKVVILLHGFPEFWYGWKRQIESLANAGFRVIAPDQRGYNLSDKPAKIADYDLDLLAKDIVGIVDSIQKQKVFLVGHDWGGIVAWWLAAKFPDRFEKVAILNAPHPVVMNRAWKNSWKQRFKGWYILFFQIPFLPEWGMKIRNYKFAIESMQKSSRPGTFSLDDFKKYLEVWKKPDALRSMLHWYRAGVRKSLKEVSRIRIVPPLLLIWGEKDAFSGKELAQQSMDFCRNGQITFLPEGTHWVQHDQPEKVNSLLKEFFQ